MNAVLLQQVWDGVFYPGDFRPALELTRARNEAYCKKHNFDYEPLIGILSPRYADSYSGSWVKVEMIERALKKYEYIVWLDADALIYDLDTDLRDGCVDGIGACWHRIAQGPHWNVGVLYIRSSQATMNFVDAWLARFPGEKPWMEQGVFNEFGRQGKTVQTISDRWNATLNVNMVPDAVVLGFHGCGSAEQRIELMKQTLSKKSEKPSLRAEVMK